MPELDGVSAMWAMREANPHLVFLVISAERGDQTQYDAKAVGAIEYLTKPYTMDELEHAVQRAAERVWEGQEKAREKVQERRKQLMYHADAYVQAQQTNAEIIPVFEYLGRDPDCELKYLTYLAMLYVLHARWNKLRVLAARLEQRAKLAG